MYNCIILIKGQKTYNKTSLLEEKLPVLTSDHCVKRTDFSLEQLELGKFLSVFQNYLPISLKWRVWWQSLHTTGIVLLWKHDSSCVSRQIACQQTGISSYDIYLYQSQVTDILKYSKPQNLMKNQNLNNTSYPTYMKTTMMSCNCYQSCLTFMVRTKYQPLLANKYYKLHSACIVRILVNHSTLTSSLIFSDFTHEYCELEKSTLTGILLQIAVRCSYHVMRCAK
jgi:hypothetical protein